MSSIPNRPTKVSDLTWLTEVREFAPRLEPDSPIWMREVYAESGMVIPCGEKHPFCEFGIILAGGGTEYIEGEESPCAPGNLLLIGPGTPHWVQLRRYPIHALTVFFLPGILLELGPLGDGAALLRRFTMRQSISDRLLSPPPKLRKKFETGMREMWLEFRTKPLGCELRLRALLTELLVAVVRWEHDQGKPALGKGPPDDWVKLERALAYLRRHFSEPIYAADLARATAMSQTRLKLLFEQTLGISWTKFLQGYRVHQAATMLCLPGNNVTDVALASGFENLSHFIKIFRRFTGKLPSAYAKNTQSAH